MNYSYKNWNEDKSCFLGKNLIIAVGCIQHCSDVDPVFCVHGALCGAHATCEIRVYEVQYWAAFSILRVLLKLWYLNWCKQMCT